MLCLNKDIMMGQLESSDLKLLKLIHDLRSPLSALKIIHGRGRGRGREENEEQLLGLALEALEAMISDCLTSVKTGRRKKVSSQNLVLIMEQLIQQKTLVSDKECFRLDNLTEGEQHWTKGRVGEWTRVINNLLDNAIEATPDSDRRIVLGICHRDGSLIISCQDNGVGMSTEDIERIFQTGFTSGQGHWGLGLSIIKEIADRNGWTVTAESELGVGTTIEISCPTV